MLNWRDLAVEGTNLLKRFFLILKNKIKHGGQETKNTTKGPGRVTD